jgi:hypothetical protein
MNSQGVRGTFPANVSADAGGSAPSTARQNGVVAPSPRRAIESRDGVANGVAAVSPGSAYRTQPKLLNELERLIDSAWAEYAASQTSVTAAQQETAQTAIPNPPITIGPPEVARRELSDREAQAMLQRIDALLTTFKGAPQAAANGQFPAKTGR